MRIEIEKTITSSILKCDKCGAFELERISEAEVAKSIVTIPAPSSFARQILQQEYHVCLECFFAWINAA